MHDRDCRSKMTRYKCTVAYEGSGYCGWQSQRNGNSVQEKIEAALSSICSERVVITGSGRTDAKVNAWGQVFHFDSPLVMSERKWKGAINGFLPDDIHIRSIQKAEPFFHARYCVKAKQYDYCINFGEYNVFERNYVYQCPYQVDLSKMEEASRIFVGTHDFSAFCSNSLKETPDQVRTVSDITFRIDQNKLTISYRGHGFLRYMVRMMTGALLDVGRGKMSPDEVRELLEKRSKKTARRNAHPEGLTLMQVDYFRILAQNESLVLREILLDDDIPLPMRQRQPEACFVLTKRHEPEILGLYDEKTGILLADGLKEETISEIKKQADETTFTIRKDIVSQDEISGLKQ